MKFRDPWYTAQVKAVLTNSSNEVSLISSGYPKLFLSHIVPFLDLLLFSLIYPIKFVVFASAIAQSTLVSK